MERGEREREQGEEKEEKKQNDTLVQGNSDTVAALVDAYFKVPISRHCIIRCSFFILLFLDF
jgi:hypothetical protein|tara:strand:+ start:249 stop:434 length:186 start_codon:yes stop_codon:yes gene_type:complete